jgi:hypothetical protein
MVLFMRGDRDGTTGIASARQAYNELPSTKAYLTFLGGSHTSMWPDPIMSRVGLDWMRWADKAMDVWGRSTADGARIAQYTYNTSNTNQRFMRQPV